MIKKVILNETHSVKHHVCYLRVKISILIDVDLRRVVTNVTLFFSHMIELRLIAKN